MTSEQALNKKNKPINLAGAMGKTAKAQSQSYIKKVTAGDSKCPAAQKGGLA